MVGPDEVENLHVVLYRLLAPLLEGVVVVDVNALGAGCNLQRRRRLLGERLQHGRT